jgi:predicted dehydrogenase
MTSDLLLPPSTAVPLRGGATLRWGVLAPGTIAGDFTNALHTFTDQRVVSVASRSRERAEAFAARFGIPGVGADYRQLVDDPSVDIVYVAAPHSEHRALALLAIAAGKHVLIEKPIAVDAAEAREIADVARAAGVYAMEAMWSRFLPQTTVIASLLERGSLGDVGLVTGDFGDVVSFDPLSRAFDPRLGGGALLDIGIYPIWFAQFVLGTPSSVRATGSLAPTGVDDQCSLLIRSASGAQALLSTSLRVTSPIAATVSGSLGRVSIDSPFIAQGGFEFSSVGGGETHRWSDDTGMRWRDGLAWQAAAIARDVLEGRTESALHPLDTSITMLETIDEARRQLGADLT